MSRKIADLVRKGHSLAEASLMANKPAKKPAAKKPAKKAAPKKKAAAPESTAAEDVTGL